MFGCKYIHILIADDNAHAREMTAAVLRAVGVQKVKTVADGEEAIAAISWYPADLAIVDYNMAPIGGLEFTKYVRSSPLSPNPFLPIILMTGDGGPQRAQAAYNAGVHDLVAKPVDVGALLRCFHDVLTAPRPFVRTPSYFGPDRRKRDATGAHPQRRWTDLAIPEGRSFATEPTYGRAPGPWAFACGTRLGGDREEVAAPVFPRGPEPLGFTAQRLAERVR
jgi:CheY-like chemotaxis protein